MLEEIDPGDIRQGPRMGCQIGSAAGGWMSVLSGHNAIVVAQMALKTWESASDDDLEGLARLRWGLYWTNRAEFLPRQHAEANNWNLRENNKDFIP